jgi:hypothetical protein
MKRNILTGIGCCLVLLFFSCEKHYNAPEFAVPKYTGPAANKTIADIKAMRVNASGVDSICRYDEQFIVKAVVVSSDEGGNYYKSMVVQDETGGIEIEIDRTGLYNDYPAGQIVYIDCRGLVVGNYHDLPQIGWEYQGGVGRINQLFLNKYIHKEGLPNADNLPEPVVIKGATELDISNVCKLVKIENCAFDPADVGLPFAGNDLITNRTLLVNSASIKVRTSNYAKFRSMSVPAGTGTIYGILTVYASSVNTWQLMLRTKDDVRFSETPHVAQVLQSFTFDANSLTTGGWRSEPGSSSNSWKYATQDGLQFVYHTNGNAVCDDWLISPAITQNDRNGVSMILNCKMSGEAGLQEFYRIYYSTTATGSGFNEAEWTLLPANIASTNDFSDAATIDASLINGSNFRIAMRYHNSNGTPSARWQIKELRFEK